MNSFEIIKQLGINAKQASSELANINNDQKNQALNNLCKNLKKFSSEIIDINNNSTWKPVNPAFYCYEKLNPKDYQKLIELADQSNKSFD